MPSSQMSPELPGRLRSKGNQAWFDLALPAGAVVSLVILLIATLGSSHWPLVHDAPLMHYVVFLMNHGFAPYRDIADMNMPGSYMLEAAGMSVFGNGATGWFLLNLASMVVLLLATAWIAGPHLRSAGIIAASYACLYHLSDGPEEVGQRDWILAVLLVLAFGCLFRFLRGGHAAWTAGILFFGGIAASIKPPALLFPFVALAGICTIERRVPARIATILFWTSAGLALPACTIFFWLHRWHAGGDLLVTLKGLVPYYASLDKQRLVKLVGRFVKHQLVLLVAAALLLQLNKSWRSIESRFLLAGFLCGFTLYLAQGKGFLYHIYPAVAFLSIFLLLEVSKALRASGVRTWIAAAALIIFAGVGPLALLHIQNQTAYRMGTINHLEADLTALGGKQLSGRVQCLDMTMGGCINVLYRLGIVQSTGFIYDFYLFPEQPAPAAGALQRRFFDQINSNPPAVFVLSEHTWPDDVYSYDQLARWPVFQKFLADNYQLTKEFVPHAGDAAGYRLYELVPGRR